MGTWDTGPFDNDTAADFGGDLDEAAWEQRESMIRGVLGRAADPAGQLDTSDGERAVAAVALVVAQHPDGEPACPHYGPSEPLPKLPADLRMLAVEALDQVVSELSELAEQWAEAANGSKWHQEITRLRGILDPPIPPQEEALFEIQTIVDSHGPPNLSRNRVTTADVRDLERRSDGAAFDVEEK